MSTPATPQKNTVYVDPDEEITGIIDKVQTSKESIVALVLPKRATMLQSVINMKLLKRAADQNNKKVVLITSESTLMPLAGTAGIHVAANLQSRPYLPAAPAANVPAKSESPAKEPQTSEDADPIDPTTPIGSLIDSKETATEPIEIDNRPKESEEAALAGASAATAKAAKAAKKDKTKKVPNFGKFRILLFAGIAALILLIGGGYWALAIAPKATVTLRTETSETPAQAQFSADTEADTINIESNTVPAKNQDLKKSETEKSPATGEKDNGTKATGNVTLRNCTDDEITIPAGTGVSNGSFTFITKSAVELNDDKRVNGNCVDSPTSTKAVSVTAQENGDQYNLSPRSYNVSGFSGIVAEARDPMTGGTSKVVKVVSQGDIDAAKKKISDRQNSVVDEIKAQLKEDGYIGIVDSFNAGTPTYSIAPAVGSEAAEVTVSGEVTYTMLGIKENDLKKIVEEQVKDKIDTTKQSILNYGFDDATFEVGKRNRSATPLVLKTTLLAGPEINQDQLKQELAGNKRSEVESKLKTRPGITEVRTDFKPFWVNKIPKKPSKVTFIIEQADGTQITR